MKTNAAQLGFKISELQQEIIELENKNSLKTQAESEKLRRLKSKLHKLYKSYDVDLED